MLFRTLEEKLTKINRSDFISDKMYDKIKSTVLEKINVKMLTKVNPKFIVTSKQTQRIYQKNIFRLFTLRLICFYFLFIY